MEFADSPIHHGTTDFFLAYLVYLVFLYFCNHTADTAIDQIKRKDYPAKIAEYTGDILLVGINYDKETKRHTCKIDRHCKKI